jgi:hypothetical protein
MAVLDPNELDETYDSAEIATLMAVKSAAICWNFFGGGQMPRYWGACAAIK